MKSSDLNKKALKRVLTKARSAKASAHPQWESDIEHLVYSFLLWNASVKQATSALRKLRAAIVDYNELRVFLPVEIVDLIGTSYPHAMDRADRLRSTLRDIYDREYETTLNSLQEMGKRDVRRYIETLDGMVPFVAGRLLIYHYTVHKMPADDHLCVMFIDLGVVPGTARPADVAAVLTREVKAEDAIAMHEGMVALVEASVAALRKAHKAQVEAELAAREPKPRPKKAPTGKGGGRKGASKSGAKKPSSKSPSKKKVTKKKVTKKAAPKKKTTKKKAAPKKTARKKSAPKKKAAAKKTTRKKAAPKKKAAKKRSGSRK